MSSKKQMTDAEWKDCLSKYSGHVVLENIESEAKVFEVLDGGLSLRPSLGDTALISIPVIRHWLFAPDRTKTRNRHFFIPVKHKGQRFVQEFHIGDVHAAPDKGYGVLTARHQKALLALQEIWQCQGGRMAKVNGRKLGLVSSSSRELEIKLFGRPGGRQSAMVRQSIQELASIPVAIKNYIDPSGEVIDVDMTGLISGAFFSDTRQSTGDRRTSFPWVEILLGDIVTRAFEQQAVKPLNLVVMRQLSGDLAALLYPKIDYLLFSNSTIRFGLKTLVRNLGLQGEVEKQKNRRRRLFAAAATELNGKPLSHGRTLHARIEFDAAVDGDDFFIAERSR